MKKGERARYRPEPPNFVEVYERGGFNGAVTDCNAHWRNVKQWVLNNGGGEFEYRRVKRLMLTGQLGTVRRIVAQWKRRGRVEMVARAEADMMALVPSAQAGE